MELAETNNHKLYKCDVCGAVDTWTDNWQWFGTDIDQENGELILYTCSDKCREILPELKAIELLKQKRKMKSKNKSLTDSVKIS